MPIKFVVVYYKELEKIEIIMKVFVLFKVLFVLDQIIFFYFVMETLIFYVQEQLVIVVIDDLITNLVDLMVKILKT